MDPDRITSTLRTFPEGSDFLISCLSAAAHHYRCATVCSPFPQDTFRTASGEKNFAAARMTLDTLPPVSHLIHNPRLVHTLPSDCRALLRWLLLHESHQRHLSMCSLEQLQQKLAHTKSSPAPLAPTLPSTTSAATTLAQAVQTNPSVRPQYIFENISPDTTLTPQLNNSIARNPPPSTPSTTAQSPSPSLSRSPSLTTAPVASTSQPQPSGLSRTSSGAGLRPHFSKSLYAFHGTSMENMHSILRSGLLNLSGTQLQRSGALFGDGIYFSTDLGVAFSFCKPGSGWSRSMLGSRLRCLLLCELDVSESSLGTKVLLEDRSTSKPLPPTYVLVKSADAVRISHILVYRDETPAKLHLGGRLNLCSLLIILYVLAMLYVGLADKAWGYMQGVRHGVLWQPSYVG